MGVQFFYGREEMTMATGTKKNFRCTDDAVWELGMTKAEQMRRDGYDVDMTLVLNSAVRQFVEETDRATAERLRLDRVDQPMPLYRRPVARVAE